jgi:hypothetical protein
MPDETVPPTSPTGTPLIPPRAFAIIGLVIAIGLAVLGALSLAYPDQHALVVALQVLSAVAGVLGIASPGVRRTVLPLLLVGVLSAGSLTSCVATKAIGRATVDCAQKALSDGAAGMLGTVLDILGGPTSDYRDRLDRLALQAGSAVVICAVQSAVAYLDGELQKRSACGTLASCYSGPAPMTDIQIARARHWLAVNGVSAT